MATRRADPTKEAPSSNKWVDEFVDYLKELYTSLSLTPIYGSFTFNFFRFAKVQTREIHRYHAIEDAFMKATITGKEDDVYHLKKSIELEEIFTVEGWQRETVLVEGTAGSGKSALSVYISQKWGEGKLFTTYKMVILLQLHDPAIQNAKDMKDLLPGKDTKMKKKAVEWVLKNNGKGVLFILDGWDKLPSNLRTGSIFEILIRSRLSQKDPLCDSAVIVTSRPACSRSIRLPVAVHLEMVGLSANIEELHQYFSKCLNGDTAAANTLVEQIEKNPEASARCASVSYTHLRAHETLR